MHRKNGILHNLGFLTLGQIASQLLNVWVLVFLAGALGPHRFGIVQIGVAFMAYALITAEWGMMSLGVRDISRLKNTESVHRYVGEQTGLMAVLALGVLGIGLLVLPFLPFTAQDPWVFRLYLVAVLPQIFMHSWVATGLERMAWVGAARILLSLVYALAILLFLPLLDSRWGGSDGFPAQRWVPLAYLLAFTASNLFLIIPSRSRFGRLIWPALPSWTEAKARLRQAAPIGAGIIVLRVLLNIDLLLLGILSTPAVAGQYAVAARIIFLMVVAVEVLWGALLPRLSRLAAESRAAFRGEFNLYLGLVLAGTLPVAVGGVLLGPDLLTFLLKDEFSSAGPVFQVLSVSYTLLAVATFLGKALIAEDRQDQQFNPLLISAVVAIVANLWLIPRFGGLGACWGMLLAHGLLFLMFAFLHRGNFNLRLGLETAALIPALAVMSIVVVLLDQQHVLMRIGGGGGAYALAAAIPVWWMVRSAKAGPDHSRGIPE